MRSILAFLPAVLLPPGTALLLALGQPGPAEKGPLLARFTDDAAAMAGVVAADATPIAFTGAGLVAVRGGPGLAARLRQAGATGVTGLATAHGCLGGDAIRG